MYRDSCVLLTNCVVPTAVCDAPCRKKIDPVVHFLDTDLGQYRLSPDRYKELRLKSERDTSDLLAGQNDKASHYRNVAFRLSAAVSDQLAALPMAEG